MQGETKERWQVLCELAANEQDPKNLLVLIKEINDILKEKQNRVQAILRGGRTDASSKP